MSIYKMTLLESIISHKDKPDVVECVSQDISELSRKEIAIRQRISNMTALTTATKMNNIQLVSLVIEYYDDYAIAIDSEDIFIIIELENNEVLKMIAKNEKIVDFYLNGTIWKALYYGYNAEQFGILMDSKAFQPDYYDPFTHMNFGHLLLKKSFNREVFIKFIKHTGINFTQIDEEHDSIISLLYSGPNLELIQDVCINSPDVFNLCQEFGGRSSAHAFEMFKILYDRLSIKELTETYMSPDFRTCWVRKYDFLIYSILQSYNYNPNHVIDYILSDTIPKIPAYGLLLLTLIAYDDGYYPDGGDINVIKKLISIYAIDITGNYSTLMDVASKSGCRVIVNLLLLPKYVQPKLL